MSANTKEVLETPMPEEQDKKQELKEEPSKEEQVVEELSDEDLKGLNGGFKFHEWKKNPTQVPMDRG